MCWTSGNRAHAQAPSRCTPRRVSELGLLDGAAGWSADAWEQALEPYLTEHGDIGTGPDARGPHLHLVDVDPPGAPPRTWRVRQILDDPQGHHDWAITAEIDLNASDAEGDAVVRIVDVGSG